MPRKDIHKDAKKAGTFYSKENQPDPSAKSEGWRKRRELKELADMLLNGERLEVAKQQAAQVGINLEDDEYTLEIVMTLRQVEKALKKGDTRAYIAAMDRMRGKAPANLDITTGGESINIPLIEWVKTKDKK